MIKLEDGVTLINGQTHGGRTSLAVYLLYKTITQLDGESGKVVYVTDATTLGTIYDRLNTLAREDNYTGIDQVLAGYDLILRTTLRADDFKGLSTLVLDVATLSKELSLANLALLNHLKAPVLIVVPIETLTAGYEVSPFNPKLNVAKVLTVSGSQLLSTSEDNYLYLMDLIELNLETLVARNFELKLAIKV